MFVPATNARIWLCSQATDMRKSFDGLAALTKNVLQQDPLSGHYFVFVNKRKTQMKILYFDPAGHCIWSKRLEQGQFRTQSSESECQALTWSQLQLLIDGIELQKYRQYKRYRHPS